MCTGSASKQRLASPRPTRPLSLLPANSEEGGSAMFSAERFVPNWSWCAFMPATHTGDNASLVVNRHLIVIIISSKIYEFLDLTRRHVGWRQCLPHCQSIHNCGQDLPVNAHFIVINIAGKAFQYMTIDSSDNVALVNLECQSRVESSRVDSIIACQCHCLVRFFS